MIAPLKRYFARRRLKPIVSVLPRRLAKAFGTREHYTFLQTKRAASDLGLHKRVEPYAFAAACRLPELEKGNFSLSALEYQRLRTELADQFSLRGADFTVKYLLATPYSLHSPALENTDATLWGSGDASGDD